MELDKTQTEALWRALSHPTRRRIVSLLASQPCTTRELTGHFAVSRYAIMKHLKVLEEADLVHVQREGRKRWNLLNPAYRARLQGESENGLPTLPPFAATSDAAAPIDHETHLPVTPARAFRAVTAEVDAWWPSRSRPETQIILEPRVGGRFYEAYPSPETGVLLAQVSKLEPERELTLWGPLGLAGEIALSRVRLILEPVDAQTTLRLAHRLVGRVEDEQVAFYNTFWREALDDRLPNHIGRAAA